MKTALFRCCFVVLVMIASRGRMPSFPAKIFAGMKVREPLKGDAVFKPSDPFDFHFHHIFGAHGTYA